MFDNASCTGRNIVPICSNKNPLKVFMKQMPVDGLYQAETSLLKTLHYKLCWTPHGMIYTGLIIQRKKYKFSVGLDADEADREMGVEIFCKEMRLVTY